MSFFKLYFSTFYRLDKTLPHDLFGYWILNDDLLFLGSFKNFTAIGIAGKKDTLYTLPTFKYHDINFL
jgi:hypothetical protein